MRLLATLSLFASLSLAAPAPNAAAAPEPTAAPLLPRANIKVQVLPHTAMPDSSISLRPTTVLSSLTFATSVDCSQTIPFKNTAAGAENFPDYSAPRVLIAVDGVNIYSKGVMVDTGSTGFTIGQNTWTSTFGKNWATTPKTTPGWKFLSSSKKLYQGYWVPVNITFKDLSWNPLLESLTEVLVYDKVVTCAGYVNADNGVCKLSNPPTETNPTGAYMGIGYGRRSDGMQQCTPQRNPLLTVTYIWKASAGCTYRNGYKITKTGLTWGLTSGNTASFKWHLLPKESVTVMDWEMPNACIGIDALPCRNGKYLPDTGVDQMYISHPDIPASGTYPPAYDIRLRIPNSGTGMADITYDNSAASGVVNPAEYFATKSVSRVYVNTGSHLWNKWETAFDADQGYQGIKAI